ncbi:MAG: hypothetical protein WD883_00360 [Candidatus Colwellbacteria bacterium]
MKSMSSGELFEVGDLVDWAFDPQDPKGPYAYMHTSRLPSGNNATERDPIQDRLLRYEKPPYRVVRVVEARPDFVVNTATKEPSTLPSYLDSMGHPQLVGVRMHLKPEHGGPLTKLRHFSGSLFQLHGKDK